ncbi:MAG: hypothetical protein JWQ96_2286 [Segetibacter sp.]|nr:hypothetical protein [Segetibacter sp.]
MTGIQSYKSFVNSHYVTEGIRMTIGILLPAFVLSFYNHLDIGIILSTGAICVSVTDNPGPIHHRRNGMLVAILSICLMTLLTGLTATSPLLLGLLLVIASFFFSMLGVYGGRAGGIGIASLLVIILNTQPTTQVDSLALNAVYMTVGGIWYMCFSLLLYNFRPYKLTQQAIGEYIHTIAEYLRIRSELYSKDVNYEETYKKLLQQQAVVQEKQTLISDLLFKTRDIAKETTHVGRILLMLFLDVTEMFDRIMNSYQRYSVLHKYFDGTGILEKYNWAALLFANELEEIGLAVKTGDASKPFKKLHAEIEEIENTLNTLRASDLTPKNLEGFVSLRQILHNLQDLEQRINTIHFYTTYDRSLTKQKLPEVDYDKFTKSERVRLPLIIDNLSLKSEIFRHSMRMSIAIAAGFLLSHLFNLGHGYWILLTIIVILKPAYSLTKKRNKDRLIGTVLGVLIGVVIVLLIKNSIALLCIMVVLMAFSYSFMRNNYLLSVLLMTPYIIMLFHLLNPQLFQQVLRDRIIDTAIGSIIAFVASFFLLPTWERDKIKPLMINMLKEAREYLHVVAQKSVQDTTEQELQLARKNALVALANLSDAFNRMLSDPKRRQTGIKEIHRFVVLNHMLVSYIATLSHNKHFNSLKNSSPTLSKVVQDIQLYFKNAIAQLQQEKTDEHILDNESLSILNEQTNTVVKQRYDELQKGLLETPTKKTLFEMKTISDQFNLIYRAVVDINKITTTAEIH